MRLAPSHVPSVSIPVVLADTSDLVLKEPCCWARSQKRAHTRIVPRCGYPRLIFDASSLLAYDAESGRVFLAEHQGAVAYGVCHGLYEVRISQGLHKAKWSCLSVLCLI